ncbi:efflux transporter outer membrane subunit [Sphingomonas sp. 2R-10]|uniref:efflux transporter outer membrane subunit n=1 Tax=Sphingomonas sp. 2R-10 TaxID=3045148 RepID=UPI000F7B20C7|nr:efflux transporter outer membrane subunit [Sphingomonas sp. 2R-10]MDJ0278272.1 efflux transporter outer membrane subunit [Sphingomonas sp. 2R-10]
MTRSISTKIARPAALGAALLVSGCASLPTLAPAPTVAPPASYASIRSLAAAPTAAWPQDTWWQAYGDRQLDTLIAEALTGSPDLAAARARVLQADGYAQQAGAARLPTLDVAGNAGLTKQSYNNGIPADFVPRGWNDTGRVEGQLGFDLDLWGRNRAGYAAARSDADAARLDLAQARLTLSTNVASAYADLAGLFAARAVQVNALEVRQQTERLTADRVTAGLDTQAELKQARSAVPAGRAELAATDEQIALTRNRIAALLGAGPDRGLSLTAPRAAIARRPLPATVTTDLIAGRPDIVAARTRVEAEASRVKVARADFYPSIRLSAVLGFQSFGLDNLFKGGSTAGAVGPAINLPIFRGGALQGRYRVARGGYDAAVADYDRTVTDAYRAVADAVVSQRALDTRLAQSREALNDAQGAYDVARLRYEGGLSRFLDVLTAQDRVLQARRIVADLEARAFTIDIALVRALGGGFAAPAGQSNEDPTHG